MWAESGKYKFFYNLGLGSIKQGCVNAYPDPHGSAYYFEKPAPDASEKPHLSKNAGAVKAQNEAMDGPGF
jgi:hypothetical protein